MGSKSRGETPLIHRVCSPWLQTIPGICRPIRLAPDLAHVHRSQLGVQFWPFGSRATTKNPRGKDVC